MKRIPTRVHGYLDYLVGALLLAMPTILGLEETGIPAFIFYLAGLLAILYSMFTAYEMGVWPAIPMRVHLTLDIISGIMLAASPWLFGFYKSVWIPYVVIGLLEIVVPLLSKTAPRYTRRKNTPLSTLR